MFIQAARVYSSSQQWQTSWSNKYDVNALVILLVLAELSEANLGSLEWGSAELTRANQGTRPKQDQAKAVLARF